MTKWPEDRAAQRAHKKGGGKSAALSDVPAITRLPIDVSRRRATMMVAHAMRIPVMARTVANRGRRSIVAVVISDRVLDAEHALDAADHAADRRADDCADRPGNAVAFVKSMRGTARHTLRLRCHRRAHQCKEYARKNCSPCHRDPFVVWRVRGLVRDEGRKVARLRPHHDCGSALRTRNGFPMIVNAF
jgi:hypothetical protein